MPKPKKKRDEIAEAIKTNPRIIREVGVWQTLKTMIEDEAINPAWRWQLYRLERNGWLTNEQREAGDRYHTLVYDVRRFQDEEPSCELDLKRIQTLKERYKGAIGVLGIGRRVVDALVIDNCHLTEREKHIVRDGLQLLANFFGLSKNKIRTDRANMV